MSKKAFLSGFLGAVLAAAILATVYHLYQDHIILHQVVEYLNKQAQPATPKESK